MSMYVYTVIKEKNIQLLVKTFFSYSHIVTSFCCNVAHNRAKSWKKTEPHIHNSFLTHM